jgi:ketosteroid isomerase-like protein
MVRPSQVLVFLICGCSSGREPAAKTDAQQQSSTAELPRRNVAADSATIVRLEHEFAQAILKRDSVTMSRIVADDFTGLASPEGFHFGKREVLVNFTNPKVTYESWKVDSLEVRVSGDMATVTGFDVSRGRNPRGTFTDSVWFLETFVWRDGRWQDFAGHYALRPSR